MSVRHALIALCLAVSPAALAAEPVPKEQLLQPPASADHFVIVSEAGKHGDEWRWKLPDGSLAYRESILLRGLVFEQDEVIKLDASGRPVSVTIRGVTPSGDAAETFAIDQAMARWKSPVDQGEAPASQAVYLPYGGTFLANEAYVSTFLKAGSNGVVLLPSGRGVIEPSKTTLAVTGPKGPETINLYFFKGIGQSPQPAWLYPDGRLFGYFGGLSLMPAGFEGNLKQIIAAQEAAIAELAPATAKKFLTAEARKPVLFRNVKIYDADKQRFVVGQNVLVSDGKIASVGTGLPKLPADARVIDGAGKTLLPGLWDSHMHVADDFNVLSEVALGVTSIRNPGGSIELAVSQRDRRAKGLLLAPESFSSVIIDKKGPLAAQGSIVVSSLEETLAAVRKVKDANLTAVKFYTSMDPAWIAPAAKLAHELGLHVHGHIPAGMRTLDAVNVGYDEITHIYFATMQAMPDEVVAKSNTTMRLLGPGKYFKDVDFAAEPTKTVIQTLRDKKIVVDPTLVVVEGVLLSEAGMVSPAYTAFVGTLPPAVERGFKSGHLPYFEGMTRADAEASFKHLVEYVATMRKAGVRIVAGTDGNGMELVRELELYVQGGMTPAEALATATIDAAANVGADSRTGSIAAGKEADLLLVTGDPEKDIGDLRHVEAVVLDGAFLDADALRKEAGFSGRPK